MGTAASNTPSTTKGVDATKRAADEITDDSDMTDAVKRWVDFAAAKHHNNNKLLVDPASPHTLADEIDKSALKELYHNLSDGEYILHITDAKQLGVAQSRAHIRIAPFREDYVQRVVKAGLMGFAEDINKINEIPDKIAFVYLDGHVHGNAARYTKAFTSSEGKALPKDPKTFYLISSQDAAVDNKDRVKGSAGSTSCVEYIHVFTKTCLACPRIPRVHGQGDNLSDMYGPFAKPKSDDANTLRVKASDRSNILGAAWVACGGTMPGDPGLLAEPTAKGSDRVPLNYHGMSMKARWWIRKTHQEIADIAEM